MKFIHIAFSILFATVGNAASINKEFDEQVKTSLRRSSMRNVPGSPQDWLDSLNKERELGVPGWDTEIAPFEWSADLARQAQGWANELAIKCDNGVPSSAQNPGDYGVTAILNMRNPQLAVERWMINGDNADKVPSAASNPMTQILWAGTGYVGCADATSDQSGKSCTSSVCYYAKAGNCAWNKYDSWQEAVLSGKACSSNCPSDVNCI